MNEVNRRMAVGAICWMAGLMPAVSLHAQATGGGVAPIEQYLMERDAEIALARSAALAAISDGAEVLVLGRHGYETAVKGTNGFVCVVERGWAIDLDDPEFGLAAMRAPERKRSSSRAWSPPAP